MDRAISGSASPADVDPRRQEKISSRRARKKVFFLLDALRRAAGGCARFGLIGERIHA